MKKNGIELAVSPDAEYEDELASPSEYVQRKPDKKASQTLSRVEVRVSEAAGDDVVNCTAGGRAKRSITSRRLLRSDSRRLQDLARKGGLGSAYSNFRHISTSHSFSKHKNLLDAHYSARHGLQEENCRREASITS